MNYCFSQVSNFAILGLLLLSDDIKSAAFKPCEPTESLFFSVALLSAALNLREVLDG